MPFAKNHDSSIGKHVVAVLERDEVREAITRHRRECTPHTRHLAVSALVSAGILPRHKERVLREAPKNCALGWREKPRRGR
jgi:phage terminase large subunit-like protein